jgi:hypothetical protein
MTGLQRQCVWNRTVLPQAFFAGTTHQLTAGELSEDEHELNIAMGYELDARVSITDRGKNVSFLSFQACFWAHPASCPMATGGNFPEDKPSVA